MKRFTLILTALMLVQLCFSQDYLARARSGKEWGYVNKKGDYIVNPQFEKARDFGTLRAMVMKNGEWGWIDNKGK